MKTIIKIVCIEIFVTCTLAYARVYSFSPVSPLKRHALTSTDFVHEERSGVKLMILHMTLYSMCFTHKYVEAQNREHLPAWVGLNLI